MLFIDIYHIHTVYDNILSCRNLPAAFARHSFDLGPHTGRELSVEKTKEQQKFNYFSLTNNHLIVTGGHIFILIYMRPFEKTNMNTINVKLKYFTTYKSCFD